MMTILILGATGFVGSKVTQLLLKEGHRVVCASRDVATTQAKFPQAEVIYCDFLHDMHSKVWLSRLAGIDVIINCVGIFYHRDQQLIWDVHLHTPQALYKAAEQTQVKYIIHLSALNIEHYHNNYAQSKLAIENVLRHTSIPS
ncbi:MAG: NAD-dependent epimerase/dehydratase family protein, partial [Legionella sp.]